MTTDDVVVIVDQDAVEGVARREELLDRSKAHVSVRLPDESMLLVAKTLFGEGDGRLYKLPVRYADLQQAARDAEQQAIVLPIIDEAMTVDKHTVTTGTVRITKTIEEHDVAVAETFAEDEVEVERVLIDREVDGPVAIRHEGDTIIIPLLEEVVVVEKRLRLREEVHIRKRRTLRSVDKPVTLRREDVRVERANTAPESTRRLDE